MDFTLFYDPEERETVKDVILPNLEDAIINHHPLQDFPGDIQDDDPVLFFASDEQVKDLLPKLSKGKRLISALPHPDARELCTGWGIDYNLEKAIEHLKNQPDPIEIDVLYNNERPVFNTLVIGHAFQLVTARKNGGKSIFSRLKTLFRRFSRLRPFGITVHYKEDKQLTTAVSGVVLVQHGKSTLLSRLMLQSSFVNDGMMHAILISPRSVTGLMLFAIRSWWDEKKLPPYAGHIKTNRMRLECDEAFEFAEDGNSLSSKSLDLVVEKKHLFILPGEHLNIDDASGEPQEIFRTDSLPKGETASELVGSPLPFILHASTEEFRDLFQVLRENARPKASFLVLMVLSTILATFGLFANSTPVVIGAMILAPLMAPIISLSMATLRQDRQLIIDSIYTILAGLGFAFLCAVIITLVTPLNAPNKEIMSRTSPNLLDLGIAVFSGVAGAYAHAREEVAKTLAGVAIAVALVPPLAVAGIGLGWWNGEIFFGAGLLLLTNLGGMVLAGAITFLFLGFSPFRLAKQGLIIASISVVLLSIPLGLGFYRMVYEDNIIETVESYSFNETVELKDVKVSQFNPLTISVRIVSDHNLSTAEIDEIKSALEGKLGKDISLEVNATVKR